MQFDSCEIRYYVFIFLMEKNIFHQNSGWNELPLSQKQISNYFFPMMEATRKHVHMANGPLENR